MAVKKSVRQIFPCPKCGSPTRNTRTQGNVTLKKCDTCGECTKVLLNADHTQVLKILEKGRGKMEKVQVLTPMQQHIKNVVEADKPKIKLHLKVKPIEDGTLIKLDPTTPAPSFEELQKKFNDFFESL